MKKDYSPFTLMPLTAFSLIELLISLIVISLITTAFAPIITKRFKKNYISQSAENIITDCSDKFSGECLMCNKTECLMCSNIIDCNGDEYLDIKDNCVCKKCSAKFSNCASCSFSSCKTCSAGFVLKEGTCTKCPEGFYANNTCKPCEAGNYCTNGIKTPCGEGKYSADKATSCKTCYGTVNGAKTLCCKYGTVLLNGTCYNPCAHLGNSFFVPTVSERSGICMMKINAGDDVFNRQDLIYQISWYHGSHPDLNNFPKVCWRGGTGVTNTPLNTSPVYEGYFGYSYTLTDRTVCTKEAAKITCEAYAVGGVRWRLPTYNELKYVMSNHAKTSTKLGSDGLQLCDLGTGFGLQCMYSNGCSQNGYNYCRPYDFWVEEEEGDFSCYQALHSAASDPYCPMKAYKNYGFSVRCVTGIGF